MNRIADLEFRIANYENRIEQRKGNPHSALRTPHSKGFTLLEVLIAVAIMAGIVSVIYMTFFTAGNNVKQAETVRDTTDMVRTLVSRMSLDIANAYINTGMSTPAAPLTVFYGKKVEATRGATKKTRYDEIYLTTLSNFRKADTPETDLCEVGYYFKEKPDGSGSYLVRREKRVLSKDVPVLEGGQEYELTDRVEGLQFRYNNGSSWSDDWSNRTALPRSVEITLMLDNGSIYVTEVDVLNAPPV